MPALDQTIIDCIVSKLHSYMSNKSGYSVPEYLTSGGSAAVFKVASPSGLRAIKVFDPKFFEGEFGDAERRRLEVQKRLIGHECQTLIETYSVDEAEGTAFLEMEYVPWKDLSEVLHEVPDETVATLIKQLVEAARFLEDQGIVHRDIKPENIKVSPDFKNLKLLDLGVSRDIEAPDSIDTPVTDHGNLRPFLATAQYSSPEYLFRLDKPSARLWKALNFYQIGAVLHDLIMKSPIFQQEMEAGNRWLVSKAVLTKPPSFADGNTGRLRELKALAARCLVKDLDLRLQFVSWDDFLIEGANDPINTLKGRLAKRGIKIGPQTKDATDSRLDFERNSFAKTFADRIRAELISICGNNLPLTMPETGLDFVYSYLFSPPEAATILCQLTIEWGTGLYQTDAKFFISALIYPGRDRNYSKIPDPIPVCLTTMGSNEDISVFSIVTKLATAVMAGLDDIEIAMHSENNSSIPERNLIESKGTTNE